MPQPSPSLQVNISLPQLIGLGSELYAERMTERDNLNFQKESVQALSDRLNDYIQMRAADADRLQEDLSK
jgi:hypothetical protein